MNSGAITSAHDAIREWCAVNEREPGGVSMEIYGDPDEEDPSKINMEILHLLKRDRATQLPRLSYWCPALF